MPREVMEYDVVIVGAGPSGLSTAIKLKQLDSKFHWVFLPNLYLKMVKLEGIHYTREALLVQKHL